MFCVFVFLVNEFNRMVDYASWSQDYKWLSHIDDRAIIEQQDEWCFSRPQLQFILTGTWPDVWVMPQRPNLIQFVYEEGYFDREEGDQGYDEELRKEID